jgi:predicted AAA+ superfamily ATPase
LSDAGLFLKGVFDALKTKIQLIVSGSSSLNITKTSEFLTGRKIDFEIEGISFFEYLTYASHLTYQKYTLDAIFEVGFDTDDIKTHLLTYLNYGSYPEVLTTQDTEKKKQILKEIISTYISKDISGFMKVAEI